jgi:hypothetical protein
MMMFILPIWQCGEHPFAWPALALSETDFTQKPYFESYINRGPLETGGLRIDSTGSSQDAIWIAPFTRRSDYRALI